MTKIQLKNDYMTLNKIIMKYLILGLIFFLAIRLDAQIITFTDVGLKNYLTNADCVDTNGDSFGDADADMNNDGEIDISEALSVQKFTFENLNQISDTIFDISELNYFSNLRSLSIEGQSQLKIIRIVGLNLDSLKTLIIGNNALEGIDISDVNNLDSLDITGVRGLSGGASGLEYLNLNNNNFASERFTLFYTENIESACVDSIAEEYNIVLSHMNGNIPNLNCITGVNDEKIFFNNIIFYPNPTWGKITVPNKFVGNEINIVNSIGQQYSVRVTDEVIDLSHLMLGVYILQIKIDDFYYQTKIIKYNSS